MTDSVPHREDEVVHRLKNHLTIVLGFCELILEDLPADHQMRGDVQEIHAAATHALQDVGEIALRLG